MIGPVLLALAVLFLVLGFLGVIGLVLGVALAVACIVALFLFGGAGRVVRRW